MPFSIAMLKYVKLLEDTRGYYDQGIFNMNLPVDAFLGRTSKTCMVHDVKK